LGLVAFTIYKRIHETVLQEIALSSQAFLIPTARALTFSAALLRSPIFTEAVGVGVANAFPKR
jgi:hypothetical protein